MLRLVEIFASIQGESTFSGLPCIFIRLAGCNLRCTYCDTKYSYRTEFTLSPDEIVEKIHSFTPLKLVEITGGEPLLQKEIGILFQLLQKQDYQILLETNGSVSLEYVPTYVHKIVDVKCPGSGEEKSFLTNNLKYLNKDKDELKFVLSNHRDYLWAKDFIIKYELQSYTILFSCVVPSVKPKELAAWIMADRLPYRLQLQLQKYIWEPDKRGV